MFKDSQRSRTFQDRKGVGWHDTAPACSAAPIASSARSVARFCPKLIPAVERVVVIVTRSEGRLLDAGPRASTACPCQRRFHILRYGSITCPFSPSGATPPALEAGVDKNCKFRKSPPPRISRRRYALVAFSSTACTTGRSRSTFRNTLRLRFGGPPAHAARLASAGPIPLRHLNHPVGRISSTRPRP